MLNHELAAQAAMYTVELSKANAFIQNHAHKRVQQTAAALHDLRNTSSSIESALMILSLDIENTQTAVKAIVTKIESVIAAQFEPVTHALINEHSTETAIDLPAEEESLSSLISKVQQDIRVFTEHLNNAGNSIDAAQHEQRGMLSDMLDMSQIEAGSLILQPTVADLRELTTRAIQILEPQAAQKHCAITTATDTTVTAWCDPKRIGRVLHNIN